MNGKLMRDCWVLSVSNTNCAFFFVANSPIFGKEDSSNLELGGK
jgi:hypothetical protein